MKKRLLLCSLGVVCLGGCVGGGSDFGDGFSDGDADGDGDSDSDPGRTVYPPGPYWQPGAPPGPPLADMEFTGKGSDQTISMSEIFLGSPEKKVLLIYHLCAT